ncbi:hypothetical protein [uncultured Ruminococcus sp.]|uniref:hypothetical protein n=1 Tax=uncultured Ruminococcus sp. TaxID=165186 RepID=UPI00260193DC|nr:hypothetical protein [uncultured Ruminococcus sp.]
MSILSATTSILAEYSYILTFLIAIVAFIVLIISIIMVAAHKKKKENKAAMQLFEDIQKDSLENKK